MIKFDENNNVQDYTIVLSLRTHKHLGQINNIEKESVVSKINMNSANELSFTVYIIIFHCVFPAPINISV